MGGLLAALIIGGLFNSIKGIYQRSQERKEGKEQAEYQLSLLGAEQKAAEKDYAMNLLSNDAQFNAEKNSALEKASLSLENATNSYLQSMKNSYLAQLEAESKYADTAAGFQQQIGGAVASQGASGARDDIFTGVLQREATRQLAEQRAMIDRTNTAAIGASKMNLSVATKEAEALKDQYSAGGVASQLRALRQASLESQFMAANEKRNIQRTFLEDLSKQYNYNFDWFMADVFGVGAEAVNVYKQYTGASIGGIK